MGQRSNTTFFSSGGIYKEQIYKEQVTYYLRTIGSQCMALAIKRITLSVCRPSMKCLALSLSVKGYVLPHRENNILLVSGAFVVASPIVFTS